MRSIQNSTLLCKSYEDSDIEISTKSHCNRFGCFKISNKKPVPKSDSSLTSTEKTSKVANNANDDFDKTPVSMVQYAITESTGKNPELPSQPIFFTTK